MPKVTLELSDAQIANILAAYRALGDKSPFFRFNNATEEIIEYLSSKRLDLVAPDARA